ncbi:MAG TPA: hypothetical protein VFM12_05410 [Gemmatimonadales bacterium]|jgi:hypothetical protein|nr:hypothetical protein [Gemmatimonadales bacterium]
MHPRRRLAQFAIFSALAALAVLTTDTATARAQEIAPDTSALQFLGFHAGDDLSEVAARMQALGGSSLRCDRARRDRRVMECRGSVPDPVRGSNVKVWLSAIDSSAAVLTLSSDVGPDQLDGWRDALERAYGRVGAEVQGPQWMMQWVRQGRMMRLTWRVGGGERVASVSLVDGRVLDAWGRSRPQGG